MFAKNSSFPVRLFSSLMILILMFGSGGVTPAHAGGGGGGADYYVKPGGGGDCSTWAQACDLQTALGLASSGQEIWVAAGVYKPTTSPSDRSATFQLGNSVSVYGGFNGTETTLDQRDPLTNSTILSGDIDNDDSQTPIITDMFTVTGNATNSYHVVTVTSYTRLDGFIITAGAANADSACPGGCGGGMYNAASGNSILENITLSGNGAIFCGGGIYSESIPELTDVYIGNNTAYFGGGMYNNGVHIASGSSPYLTDVTFENNTAILNGGGMFNANSNPDLENVIFRGNTANSGGGGLFNAANKNGVWPMQLTHVTFDGNAAANGGGMYNDNGANLTLTNVTFSGNVSSSDGGGMSNNLNSSPTLTNVTFFANTAVDQGGGLFNLTDSSPTLKNVTFQSNSANQGGGIYNSVNSNPDIRNTILWGNPGVGGAQIYNDATSTPVVSDSIIEGGYAGGSYIHTFDPKLGTFGDHGGFTHTISLLPGSSAIDSGWDPDCATTDQRGIFRPQGPYCDIGAYEFVATFADVPTNYWAWQFVERLYNYGVTGGCGGGSYCPGGNVTRAQMAVFLLKSKYGTSYSPPPASGTVFADVPAGYWAAAWIEALSAENITSGCGGGNYCPNGNVTRAQMAVFLLRAKYGSSYYPPAATGTFSDVPTDYWAATWIEALAAEGITGGCGGGNYCPSAIVNRGQMAPFLVVTFGLP